MAESSFQETILLVDDNPSNLDVLTLALEEQNYKIMVSHSGEEAIESFKITSPDLIILDIMMPGIGGLETCRKLKSDETLKDIPVIFITAIDQEEIKLEGLRAGAIDYITKPFNEEEVLTKVHTHLTLRRLQKELKNMNQELEKQVMIRTSDLREEVEKHRRTEIELRKSELRYRSLFESAPGAILLINPETNTIVGVNPAAENLLSGKSEELINKSLNSFFRNNNTMQGDFTANDLPKIREDSLSKARIFENVLINSKGEEVPVEVSVKAVVLDDTLLLQAIFKDISGWRKAEDELKNAMNKAEEMNQIKTNFLANMSHELRTPLIGILGFSEELMEELGDEEHQEMASIIYSSGKRLLETLNLILDLSRIEKGNLDYMLKQIDLRKEVYDIVGIYRSRAEEKGLYFELNMNTQVDIVARLDKRMLNSIITNLLDNAVKYTTNGGVTVDVDIETENERDWSVIRIKDTGIGIPAESLDVIFDEFRQVSEGFNRSFEGSGLGLTITKRFVEVMHGRISIESKEGIGTMFILRFPTESAEIMIKESAEKKDDERRIRILHVEDDPTARKLVKYMLQKKYAVDFAENGKKAIAMAKIKQYDIILMDINLGKAMSGVEVTKELKKLPSYEHVPIIAVTAYAMKGDDKMFLAAGCTHYVSKPFQKQMFLELISELTQQQENEDNQENQYNQDN